MGKPKARKPARIGIVFDGIFWQNLHDWREYAHPEPKRFDMQGVLDSMRWYAADTVFSRPADDVTIPAKHLIWTDGRRRNDLQRIMELVGIEFRCVPVDPRTDRGIGFEMELALTGLEVIYGPPRLDLLFLLTCTDNYLPLVRRVKQAGVKLVIPNISVDYEFETDSRKRHLVTTARLTDTADYSPAWAQLLEPGGGYPLVPPLYDIPPGESQRPIIRR
jgi:hypothetical protein